MEASCHCGRVRLTLERAPSDVTDCNCSICRRYGVLWAYYVPAEVRLTPAAGGTDIYMWYDRELEFHRCKNCGCVTLWVPVDEQRQRMGINARLLDPEILAGARVRRLDGAVTWRYLEEEPGA